MSGGHFDNDQHIIFGILEVIEEEIQNNSCGYSVNTLEEFKEAVRALKKARIYVHRIDWLLSGDDGEETFHERLKEDLNHE